MENLENEVISSQIQEELEKYVCAIYATDLLHKGKIIRILCSQQFPKTLLHTETLI